MDLAQATGAVETIDLAGQSYPVRLLTLKEWGVVTAWLKRENPSPVTRAVLAIQQARTMGEPLDAAAQDELLDHAQRAALNWPPRLGSTAWFEAIDRCEGGQARLLFEVLSKADPSFSLERADVLAPTLSTSEWNELIRVSFYGEHPERPKDRAP